MSDFWQDRKVFLTGATGFVGSWTTDALISYGAQVFSLVLDDDPLLKHYRGVNDSQVTIVTGNLNDFDCLEQAIIAHETDTVIHLGAQTLVGVANQSPLETFESNIRGTYNLLEACRMHPDIVSRVVVASSDKAYGDQPVLPYTEETDLQGQHPYDVSKSCADLIAQAYHRTYGLPVVVARCGNIYGGGDLNWSRIVPGTIRSVSNGEHPIIRSDGSFLRDYIYIKDVVAAYLTLAEQLEDERVQGEAFNFGLESPVAVLDLVSHILRLMGRENLQPEIQNQAKGEIHDQYLSSEKSMSVLNWRPAYEMESGLQETIIWYEKFLAQSEPVASGETQND